MNNQDAPAMGRITGQAQQWHMGVAVAAMQALANRTGLVVHPDTIAQDAFNIADAMLRELQRRGALTRREGP